MTDDRDHSPEPLEPEYTARLRHQHRPPPGQVCGGGGGAAVDKLFERETDARDSLPCIIDLNEAWHAAKPDEGYDAKAAEWRAKLRATSQPSTRSDERIGK